MDGSIAIPSLPGSVTFVSFPGSAFKVVEAFSLAGFFSAGGYKKLKSMSGFLFSCISYQGGTLRYALPGRDWERKRQ